MAHTGEQGHQHTDKVKDMWSERSTYAVERQAARDAVARVPATWIIHLRHAIVALLQRLESRCSRRQKTIYLVLFCGLFGGYCLSLLIRPTDGTGERARMVMPEHNKGSPAPIPPYHKDTTEHFKSNK